MARKQPRDRGGRFARSARAIVLQLTLLICTYLVMEVGYRAFQYLTLPRRIVALVESKRPRGASSMFVFDADTGYRYAPNVTTPAWKTNSYGHISAVEYPRAKPPGEFRIAVVGDSFTADITGRVRWTDVLERDLNGSPEWKSAIGGSYTRVINFGVDGFGIVQMAAMLRHHALEFQPDRVLVNFIVDDILRRVTYREPLSEPDLAAYVQRRFMGHVDWLTPCPALVSQTVGRLWGMSCGLPLRADAFLASSPELRYTDRQEALTAAATAIRSIIEAAPGAVFFQAPLRPEWVDLVDDLQRLVPELKIMSMRAAVEALPPPRLFIPNGHYTDEGTILYGHAIARELIRSTQVTRP